MSTIHAHKNPHAHPVHAHQLGGGKGKHPSHGARLTFHIATGTLSGTAGGKSVTMHAFSGGGGGSKSGWVQKGAVNNPLKTGLKTSGGHSDHKKHVHGGPIPVGHYTISTPDGKHPNLGKMSAQLTPGAKNHMHGRGGFFIHGRGPHGSDGCIVPDSGTDFHTLMELLLVSHGGTLLVVSE